jgi:hypothetical protein
MRNLFTVCAKLGGLFQIYRGLTVVLPTALFFSTMGNSQAPNMIVYVQVIGSAAISGLLTFGMAWLLLCRTQWLADILKIPEGDVSGALEENVILRTGVKLIGVYIAVQAIPVVFRISLQWLSSAAASNEFVTSASSTMFLAGDVGGIWSGMLTALLQLGLGVFMLSYTGTVLGLVTKHDNSPGG